MSFTTTTDKQVLHFLSAMTGYEPKSIVVKIPSQMGAISPVPAPSPKGLKLSTSLAWQLAVGQKMGNVGQVFLSMTTAEVLGVINTWTSVSFEIKIPSEDQVIWQMVKRDFLGAKTQEKTEDWLAKITLGAVTVEEQVHKYLLICLTPEQALQMNGMTGTSTAKSLFTMIITLAMGAKQKEDIGAMFYGAKQEATETVTEFAWRIKGLQAAAKAIHIQIDDEEVKLRLLNGCNDKLQATKVQIENDCVLRSVIEDPREAKAKLLINLSFERLMHMLARAEDMITPTTTVERVTPIDEKVSTSTFATDLSVRCYACGERGHMAAACERRMARVCYSCRGEGHIARDCRKRFRPEDREISDGSGGFGRGFSKRGSSSGGSFNRDVERAQSGRGRSFVTNSRGSDMYDRERALQRGFRGGTNFNRGFNRGTERGGHYGRGGVSRGGSSISRGAGRGGHSDRRLNVEAFHTERDWNYDSYEPYSNDGRIAYEYENDDMDYVDWRGVSDTFSGETYGADKYE